MLRAEDCAPERGEGSKVSEYLAALRWVWAEIVALDWNDL